MGLIIINNLSRRQLIVKYQTVIMQSKTNESNTDGGLLDIAAFLKHYGVLVVKEKPYKGCILFYLEKSFSRRIMQLAP